MTSHLVVPTQRIDLNGRVTVTDASSERVLIAAALAGSGR
jgi:hypothetical protein